MIVQCPNCGETLESDGEIAEGQHALCPCCDKEFQYISRKKDERTNCKEGRNALQDVGQRITRPYREKTPSYGLQHASPAVRESGEKCVCGRKWSKPVWMGSICVIAAIVFCCCLLRKSSARSVGENHPGTDRMDVQEANQAESQGTHYSSSEELKIDFGDCVSREGVLGFKWGEKPRNSKYKVPCEVEYPSPHALFSKMQLIYGSKGGLRGVSFSAKYDVRWPDVSDLPGDIQREALDDYFTSTILPIFQPMKEEAERILCQEIPCACVDASLMKHGLDKILGITRDASNGCMCILRMDLKGKNPEEVFAILTWGQPQFE